MNETLLLQILSQPTAPYREKHVSDLLEALFKKKKVPYFLDPIGNLVVGVSSEKAYRKLLATSSKTPLHCFIAHMDHPGFHGMKWLDETTLEATWHGGSPTYYLEGSPVWLASEKGWEGEATIQSAKLRAHGTNETIESLTLTVSPTFRTQTQLKATALFGGHQFRKPVWQDERDTRLLYTKAADDLVGTAVIASLALEHFKKKSKQPFLALLTRAEETGWIGAIGHLKWGILPKAKRKVVCVSLETSRTLPGAIIGNGPVVRLGDRSTVFDASELRHLTTLAVKKLKGKHQRRIMDGGSCEATATTAYGLPSIGISIPLGNYHNQSFEGGPDSRGPMGPAPEFVHLDDVKGMYVLCKSLIEDKKATSDHWAGFRKSVEKSYQKARKLL